MCTYLPLGTAYLEAWTPTRIKQTFHTMSYCRKLIGQLNGYKYTVNGESFTGLNFCGFHGFVEDRESFPMNILL